MVQAILAGRKTQTRRVVKDCSAKHLSFRENSAVGESGRVYNCPYGQTGDVLWVRESFAKCIGSKEITPSEMASAFEWTKDRFIVFKADSTEDIHPDHPEWGKKLWKPSIHMPKDACRIWLEITDLRVERLQDIGRQDALSEGIYQGVELEDTKHEIEYYQYVFGGERFPSAVQAFSALWQSINEGNWNTDWNINPWVWVVEFKQIENPNNNVTNKSK
jgi:hypothetical protein